MDEQYKQHGAFSWSELLTTDVKAAKTFYTQLFGWDTEEMSMPGTNFTVVTGAFSLDALECFGCRISTPL